MFLYTLIVTFALFITCRGVSYDGCDLFENRFTVENNKFQDVCGSKTFTISSGSLSSSDQVYDFTGNNKITFGTETFTGNRFAIVIEARRTVPKSSGFDIILGPGGCNCQIRYEAPNKLGIYSYYTSPTYWQSFTLPDDIDKLHTLILYYNYGKLYIYQNNKLVKTITKSFDIGLGMIGGWYGSSYYADIAVKNIMFAKNKGITDIKNYVYTCVALSGISTNNAVISGEISASNGLTAETEETGSIINTPVILAFFIGMATMLVLIVFCFGIYGCYKTKQSVNNDKILSGVHVLQQIEMDEVNANLQEDEMDGINDESKQITNGNEN